MNIKKLPKIELHCHIDGSIRPKTMFEILKESGKISTSYEEFQKEVMIKGECNSLIEYLEKFEYPNKVMQTKENIERIVYEVMEDAFLENVKYIELRFAPKLHMKKGLKFDEIVESAISGLKKAEKNLDIKGNLIVCIMRGSDLSDAIDVVENSKKFLNKGVVAIDLAGDEANYPPEIYKDAFDLAYKYGFNITIHAGETGISENIIKSIDLLHASRIGHGVNAKDDKFAFNKVLDNNVFLEMCPTSNIQTKAVNSYIEHPIIDFLNKDIKVTLNTDNRTVSNVNMTKEFEVLENELKSNLIDFKNIYLNSIDAAFISDKEKESLRKYVSEFI